MQGRQGRIGLQRLGQRHSTAIAEVIAWNVQMHNAVVGANSIDERNQVRASLRIQISQISFFGKKYRCEAATRS